MPNQDAAQTLYETAKALLNVPSTPHPAWYEVLKDFQPFGTAILAGAAAFISAKIAYRAASLAYQGTTDKIKADAELAEEANKTALKKLYAEQAASNAKLEFDKNAVARDWERRKLVSYLSLRYHVRKLRYSFDLNVRTLQSSLNTANPPDDPNDPIQLTTVIWKYEEPREEDIEALEHAWEQIDLFSAEAIELIDEIRTVRAQGVDFLEDIVTKELQFVEQRQQREGEVGKSTALFVQNNCRMVVTELDSLIAILDRSTDETLLKLKGLE